MPNQLLGVRVRTRAISGLSRVRNELVLLLVIPPMPPHPVQTNRQPVGHRYFGGLASRQRNLLLVLLNLPLAFVGGVLAALLTAGNLSLGSLVGFVTLFGTTLRNSIMLISHYEHLVEAEGMPWGPDAALRGASERLAPILMTALVAALGLLPRAIGSGDPCREIEGPMAIVILGGLATSTLLNLFVLPSLALRYGKFGPKHLM